MLRANRQDHSRTYFQHAIFKHAFENHYIVGIVETLTTIPRTPDFLLIGAQKSGTSWLWKMLDQHPGTDLPAKKEIHYFGGAENYQQGLDTYLSHFEYCDPNRVTGEASTSYFFDRMPFWFNKGREIEYVAELAPIPELVAAQLPDARIIVVLRDPVNRAISAYRHWMKKGDYPPLKGLQRTAIENPKTRIVEYGYYEKYLAKWKASYSDDRMLVLVFEEDVVANPRAGLTKLYDFLGLDTEFVPNQERNEVHRSWSWTRSTINYYAGPFRNVVCRGRVGKMLDRYDFLDKFAVGQSSVRFLRRKYLPQKKAVETLLGRNLDCWDYGLKLMGSEYPGAPADNRKTGNID